MLHNPAETPRPNQQYILASIDRQHAVLVYPQLTTTSKNVYHLSAEVRKCYWTHEKLLKFFKIYTQNNCKIECFANITQQTCGCVPFYIPRKISQLVKVWVVNINFVLGNANTKICGYGKLECVSETRSK